MVVIMELTFVWQCPANYNRLELEHFHVGAEWWVGTTSEVQKALVLRLPLGVIFDQEVICLTLGRVVVCHLFWCFFLCLTSASCLLSISMARTDCRRDLSNKSYVCRRANHLSI